jgi:hypothetical protein
VDLPLRNPAELSLRLELSSPESLLLIDAPEALRALAEEARKDRGAPEIVRGEAIRSVKTRFDGIVLWREERPGALSLLASAARRLAPGGALWVVVARRKVAGVRTPAIHRLNRGDLQKALARDGFVSDREVGVSAWHVAYRFARPA